MRLYIQESFFKNNHMATITEKINKVLKRESEKKQRLNEVSERYDKLVSKGVVKKSTYNLPLKDTLGKNYYFNIGKK